MTVPAVNLTELEGQIGALRTGLLPLAIIGTADAGTANLPVGYSRKASVVSDFTGGTLVQAAGEVIEKYGLPVTLVKSGASQAGTHDNLVTVKTGTSVITISGTTSNDDYIPAIKVTNGGTIGVAGITLEWSLDGGLNYSAPVALGVANSFTFPGSGGLSYAFGAGTLVTGDLALSLGHAPRWNTTEIGTALNALRDSSIGWEMVLILGAIDGSGFDAIETAFGDPRMRTKTWIGNTRGPNYVAFVPETEAAYLTAINTIFSGRSTTHGCLCAGDCQDASGIDFRQYGTRHIAQAVGARLASVEEHIDIAAIDLGALPGVSIRDPNGNPVPGQWHDELLNPGLDDARFTTLRSWDGYGGVFVNNPRIFSTAGSDFEFVQHRRVLGLAERALYSYLVRRLSKPIRVSVKTGKILEEDAQEIETGADSAIRAVLMAKPKASGGGFSAGRFVQLSRDDLLLQTKTLTGQCRVVPLAYPKFIDFDIGLFAPKLQTVLV